MGSANRQLRVAAKTFNRTLTMRQRNYRKQPCEQNYRLSFQPAIDYWD
jgi:hypothetical protein